MKTLAREELMEINGGAGTLTGLALGVITDIGINYCKDVAKHPDDYREKRSSHCSCSLCTGRSL